jgi:hypothetical protein
MSQSAQQARNALLVRAFPARTDDLGPSMKGASWTVGTGSATMIRARQRAGDVGCIRYYRKMRNN